MYSNCLKEVKSKTKLKDSIRNVKGTVNGVEMVVSFVWILYLLAVRLFCNV